MPNGRSWRSTYCLCSSETVPTHERTSQRKDKLDDYPQLFESFAVVAGWTRTGRVTKLCWQKKLSKFLQASLRSNGSSNEQKDAIPKLPLMATQMSLLENIRKTRGTGQYPGRNAWWPCGCSCEGTVHDVRSKRSGTWADFKALEKCVSDHVHVE